MSFQLLPHCRLYESPYTTIADKNSSAPERVLFLPFSIRYQKKLTGRLILISIRVS